jgi:hypothetical protein
VHEAVLEDRLGDDALALREAHHHEKLSLHVRGEARVRRRRHVHRAKRAVPPHADGVPFAVDVHAGLPHLEDERLQILHVRALEEHVAAGDGGRHHVRAGLDAVRDDGVVEGVQRVRLLALDVDDRRARAVDLGAHLVEHAAELLHFRLASAVVERGRALREGRGHHQVLRAGHRREVENHLGTLEAPTSGLGDHVAVLEADGAPHGLEALQVLVDGARARSRSLRGATPSRGRSGRRAGRARARSRASASRARTGPQAGRRPRRARPRAPPARPPRRRARGTGGARPSCRCHGAWVRCGDGSCHRRAAWRRGWAAPRFLAPLTRTVPLSTAPPLMRIASIGPRRLAHPS